MTNPTPMTRELIVKWLVRMFVRPCDNCGRSTLNSIDHVPTDDPGVCWLVFAPGAAERSDHA